MALSCSAFPGWRLVNDLGVDDVFVSGLSRPRRVTGFAARRLRLRLGVHRLTELLAHRGELLSGTGDRGGVLTLKCLLEIGDRGLDLALHVGGHLVAALGQELLSLVRE